MWEVSKDLSVMHLSENPSDWNTGAIGRRLMLRLASGALTAACLPTAALARQFEAVYVDVRRIEVFAYGKIDSKIESVITQAQLTQIMFAYVSNQLHAKKVEIDVALAGDSESNEAASLPNQVLQAILVLWMQTVQKDDSDSPALLGAVGIMLRKNRHSLELHANHLELFEVPVAGTSSALHAIEQAVQRELDYALIQPLLMASR
jgi:hypothetical protein